MENKLVSQEEIDEIIKGLKQEGFSKEQSIKLQEDVCAASFRDCQFYNERWESIRFSKATKKEKRETSNCLNKAIKEHLKQLEILEYIKNTTY